MSTETRGGSAGRVASGPTPGGRVARDEGARVSRPGEQVSIRSSVAPRPSGSARTLLWGIGLAALLVVSIVVAFTIGPAALSPADVLASVGAHLGFGESTLSPIRDGIVWQLRMPRVLTAAAVGAGLAICGAVMQALTRNPLADPYLLGLSSGASVRAVVVFVLGWSLLLPVAAFTGAWRAPRPAPGSRRRRPCSRAWR